MSINHFSSDLPETHWWSQQPEPPIMDNNTPSSKTHYLPEFYHHQQYHHQAYNSSTMSTLNFNLNHEDNNDEELDEQQQDELQQQQQQGGGSREVLLDKEPMFEKPLTPSDVGKLNRLVIPKQHAEKYFPLGASGGSDTGDKGLLLSFEDESGKFWRFRYSYWNSSQSYVLTKGWSRYVKEKRLDAGDVVLFERHRTDTERMFIGWRRRAAPDSGRAVAQLNDGSGETGGWTRMLYSAHPYPTYPHLHHHHAVPYRPDSLHAGSAAQNQTTTSAVGNSKILRLFGVNMECQAEHDDCEPSTPDGSSLSSHGPTQHHFYPPPDYSDHMEFTFSRDVKHMRNRRG